jgi:CheY-like chemotaxis protein
LVVEDEQMLREVFVLILEQGGYAVDAAADGKEAIDLCARTKYDLIMLDLMMPELNGVGFLRQADLRTKAPDTRILIFSNLSSGHDLEEAFALGAHSHYLKADLTPKDLLERLEADFNLKP